jgi:cysteine desulfurase
MAVKGIVPFRRIEDAYIISSAIEHDTVLQPLRFLKGLGARISLLPVDRFGIVSPEDVAKGIAIHTDAAQSAGKIVIDVPTLRACRRVR